MTLKITPTFLVVTILSLFVAFLLLDDREQQRRKAPKSPVADASSSRHRQAIDADAIIRDMDRKAHDRTRKAWENLS